MSLASRYERSHRNAPARNFNGGYVSHGPIVSDLRPARRLWDGIGTLLAMLGFFAFAFAFAAMTP